MTLHADNPESGCRDLEKARRIVDAVGPEKIERALQLHVFGFYEGKLLRQVLRERGLRRKDAPRTFVVELDGHTSRGPDGIGITGINAKLADDGFADQANLYCVTFPFLPIGYGPEDWAEGLEGRFKITVEFKPEEPSSAPD